MEWFILLLILVAAAAGGYYFGRGTGKPEVSSPSLAERAKSRTRVARERLRIHKPKKEAARFVAWLANLPEVDEAFKTWLEGLTPGEAEALAQSAADFGSDLQIELASLLDGHMDDDADLKREVEEAIVLYCLACWKATLVRGNAEVFAAFLAWQDTPDEHKEFSRRLFAKLVETGSISVSPERYLAPEEERQRHDELRARDLLYQTAQTAPPADRRDEAWDRDAHRAARITSLRLPREVALSASQRTREAVLSTVERVIFLKEVPLFKGMTIEQLQILADVSEESTYREDEVVFAEGDTGDALYVVVSGCVSIEQTGKQEGTVVHVGTRSSRQYFGELAIFDEEPRSASIIACEPTLLLSLRRAPLVALIREDSTLALELIRVLSLRLREAHRQVADKAASRPRELEKFI